MDKPEPISLSGRFYQFLVFGIIGLFVGIMLVVAVNANMKVSGNTGLDAVEMEQARHGVAESLAGQSSRQVSK